MKRSTNFFLPALICRSIRVIIFVGHDFVGLALQIGAQRDQFITCNLTIARARVSLIWGPMLGTVTCTGLLLIQPPITSFFLTLILRQCRDIIVVPTASAVYKQLLIPSLNSYNSDIFFQPFSLLHTSDKKCLLYPLGPP